MEEKERLLKELRAMKDKSNIVSTGKEDMPVGEEIIFRRGMKPIFTKRYNIFENDMYKQITEAYEEQMSKKKAQEDR